MAKIFDVQDWLKNHPNRNNFDLTHKVHGSYQMGKLYPVLCKPVVPTDSFRIDTAVSLRFTPMPFPTQSNMRVIFHYFYVRNKNIWKNWSNWLQGLEEHTPPYVVPSSQNFFRHSTLSDYLGVPSSFHVGNSETAVNLGFSFGGVPLGSGAKYDSFKFIFNTDIRPGMALNSISSTYSNSVISSYNPVYVPFLFTESFGSRTPYLFSNLIHDFEYGLSATSTSTYFPFVSLNSDTRGAQIIYVDSLGIIRAQNFLKFSSSDNRLVISRPYLKDDNFDFSSNPCKVYFLFKCSPTVEDASLSEPIEIPLTLSSSFSTVFSIPPISSEVGDSGVSSPFYSVGNTGNNTIKVSALPYRAYESIYNAFYRSSQGVQPFVVDGVTKYNQYVTNDGDGADSTDYHLFERNWELDAYTSCLISPQQGNVPYVGITDISALGRMTVETPSGNVAEVRLSDNGDGVEISNLHGDTQESRAYALRAASSGFTIPEFRESNALQKFLEMNIRKGYKYIDFIEGHFGKKPTYAEMDMPEFIGGFSQRISVNEISNTNGVDSVGDANDKLGFIAGQARAIGGSKHGISHYFDDFGFVVGIMCIVPDNAYDSILPKHFNLKEPLDCYFPEFSQLSYMPLTHEELAPIQTVNDPRGSSYRDLTKVFGYQRPNHDLVWYPDTVHGLFRDASGIGNSIICRRFSARPELSNDFLTIKPSETDTIFNYTFGDNDVCLGEVVLKISAKRPIPRLVVPQIS